MNTEEAMKAINEALREEFFKFARNAPTDREAVIALILARGIKSGKL